VSAAGTSGTGSASRRCRIGYLSTVESAKQDCHYAALHRGAALTSTHRNNQYAALGW